MKGKKLLSMFTACALAVTMVMPAMAADGGELDVGVTTKTAVIRVQVPTTMAIAVDQFMMGDAGTQISSSEFEMANKSEVNVKVEVTSTATLGANTKLVDTKAGAKSSTKAGEAWLGVVAKTNGTGTDEYDDPTTATSPDYAAEQVGTVSENNINVQTFTTGATATEGKAVQTFYLKKGTGSVDYTMLNANEDSSSLNYAQFYELSPQTVAGDPALKTLIASNDVYVATAAAADTQSLTRVEKGGTHPYVASEVYYTAAAAATAKEDLAAAKLYVYGGTATADATEGNAAFRYVGALSGAQETWTNTDISRIKIKYDIVGVTADKYTEVKTDCKYGLYVSAAPTASATTITAGGAAVTITLPAGITATKFEKTKADGTYNELPADHYTWNATTGELKVKTSFTSSYGAGKKVKVTFSNGASIVLDVK